MTTYDELKASNLERAFVTRWRQLAPTAAPEPVAEYEFLEDRKFRLDFAWPEHKVGLELQGGTWTKGAHVRGKGYREDCEKLNLAQLDGWIVLWVTTDMLSDDPMEVVEMILRAIEIKRANKLLIHQLTAYAERLPCTR